MATTVSRPLPSLAPEPAPLVELRERHRAACRMASLHGLDMNNPEHHAEIARLMGWDIKEGRA